MSQLDQSMKNIIAANGLIHLEISVSEYDWRGEDSPDRIRFHVSGQWRDATKDHNRGIATGIGATIEDALRDFAVTLAEKRPAVLADVALPELAA